MYTTLYQYLIQHKHLSIPGIGNFKLSGTPAHMDFPERRVDPPAYHFSLEFPATASPGNFFYWLGTALGVSDREAIIRFNNFSFDMRKQIMDGSTIDWKGVGSLSKGLAGEIRFVETTDQLYHARPITAEKVIRSKPEHMVRVGEDQKTALEMAALLGKQDADRSFWWAVPLAICLLAIVFIGWYFSEHGVAIQSTGNSKHTPVMESHQTYSLP